LPDTVLAGGRPASAATGEVPAALKQAATGDVGLREAKDRWMSVLEASYLRDLLDRHGGNVSAAAKTAGIDRKTFHRLINKHGLKT
jgi:transcriptional regulator of acetoin/glycerol metabolism